MPHCFFILVVFDQFAARLAYGNVVALIVNDALLCVVIAAIIDIQTAW